MSNYPLAITLFSELVSRVGHNAEIVITLQRVQNVNVLTVDMPERCCKTGNTYYDQVIKLL